jgi:DNA-binding PadR family transcriptional regulator
VGHHLGGLSPTDFHVLLVLAGTDLYGYAILKAVRAESLGRVRPDIGSLYRVLGRLMSRRWVEEVGPPRGVSAHHRGRPRRYYRLTAGGRRALAAETKRIEGALELARKRACHDGATRS